MAAEQTTVINFPTPAEPFGVRRVSLGRAAHAAEVVMSLTRGMFGDPLVSHAICRFPDGRYALTETTGGDCVMIGEPIEISEAMNLARSILDGDQVIARAPVAVHSVALMLLALIGEGAKRQAAGGAYGSL